MTTFLPHATCWPPPSSGGNHSHHLPPGEGRRRFISGAASAISSPSPAVPAAGKEKEGGRLILPANIYLKELGRDRGQGAPVAVSLANPSPQAGHPAPSPGLLHCLFPQRGCSSCRVRRSRGGNFQLLLRKPTIGPPSGHRCCSARSRGEAWKEAPPKRLSQLLSPPPLSSPRPSGATALRSFRGGKKERPGEEVGAGTEGLLKPVTQRKDGWRKRFWLRGDRVAVGGGRVLCKRGLCSAQLRPVVSGGLKEAVSYYEGRRFWSKD